MYNIEYKDLPNTLLLLENNEELLFPFGSVKLEISEPKDIALINDCMRQNRIVGLVQCNNDTLYNIGCAGKIIEFIESTDNKYYIEIYGICRYKIINLIESSKGYNEAVIDWNDFQNDFNPQSLDELDQEKLSFLLKNYFTHQGLNVDWQSLKHTANETLINSLASIYPFEISEKQSLLEANNIIERSHLLANYLQPTNDD